jgi:hypothetical protein
MGIYWEYLWCWFWGKDGYFKLLINSSCNYIVFIVLLGWKGFDCFNDGFMDLCIGFGDFVLFVGAGWMVLDTAVEERWHYSHVGVQACYFTYAWNPILCWMGGFVGELVEGYEILNANHFFAAYLVSQ